MVMATFARAVNPALHASLPYDTDKAFAPVALIGHSANVLVVNPKLPFHSVQELLAYAKANPGKLNYGSTGVGTSAHLAGELLKDLAGIDMTHVAYKGAAPAVTDLLSGQIQVMLITAASATSYVKSGQLRALAVTSAKRSPAFPDLPTLAEAGVPGYTQMNALPGSRIRFRALSQATLGISAPPSDCTFSAPMRKICQPGYLGCLEGHAVGTLRVRDIEQRQFAIHRMLALEGDVVVLLGLCARW